MIRDAQLSQIKLLVFNCDPNCHHSRRSSRRVSLRIQNGVQRTGTGIGRSRPLKQLLGMLAFQLWIWSLNLELAARRPLETVRGDRERCFTAAALKRASPLLSSL